MLKNSIIIQVLLLVGLHVGLVKAQINNEFKAKQPRKFRLVTGPKIGTDWLEVQVYQEVENYIIYSLANRYDSYRLGAFARLEQKKLYLQTEDFYSYNSIFYQFYNTDPAAKHPNFKIHGTGYLLRRVDICPQIGYKPKRWLHFSAGPHLHF